MTDIYKPQEIALKIRNGKKNNLDSAIKEMGGTADENASKRKSRKNIRNWGLALAGIVVGGVVGYFTLFPPVKDYVGRKEKLEQSLATRNTINNINDFYDGAYKEGLASRAQIRYVLEKNDMDDEDTRYLDSLSTGSTFYLNMKNNYLKSLKINGKMNLYHEGMPLSQLARIAHKENVDALNESDKKLIKSYIEAEKALIWAEEKQKENEQELVK